MIINITEMIIGNISVSVIAIKLFSILRTRTGYLDTAILGFLWIYTTTLYTLILGCIGLLDSHIIAFISGIGLILIGISNFKKYPRHLRVIKNWVKSLPETLTSFRFSLLVIFLLFLSFLQLSRIFFHIWFIPPYVWDTVVYHLVNVAEWVQKGEIHAVITPVDRVYWPASFELLETWFVVFLHNDLLVKLAPFLFYLVAGTSAYAIARALNLTPLLSASVVIFYLFTPSLAIQATACKNDVGIAAVYLLIIAILFELSKNRDKMDNKLLIILMAFSLGIGIKAYMFFIIPAPVFLGLALIFKCHFVRSFRSIFRFDKVKSNFKTVICILLILSSVFLGSYWYIRNLVVFNNPFHPTDFRIFGHLVFGTGDAVRYGPGQRGSASWESLKSNTLSLITDKIFDQRSFFDSSLGNISGWGWFNFVCGISAMLYALIFVNKLRLLIISFLLSLLTLFAFISIDPWYMRFTLWFPIIFALSFGFLIFNLNNKWLKNSLMAMALLCTMFNWIAVLNVGEISLDDFKKMMQIPALKRSTAQLTNHYDGAYRKTLDIVPKDEIIGFCFPNNGWAYPLYDSDLSRRLKYIPIKDINFVEYMKEQNILYLFVERITPEQLQFIQKAVQEGYLKKIEEFLYALSKN